MGWQVGMGMGMDWAWVGYEMVGQGMVGHGMVGHGMVGYRMAGHGAEDLKCAPSLHARVHIHCRATHLSVHLHRLSQLKVSPLRPQPPDMSRCMPPSQEAR